MANLLTSLVSSAQAMRVIERALEVSQNNVTNASTPGYAAQRLSLESAPFEPSQGLIGGVKAGEIESARNQYADQAVRRELESQGYQQQLAESLTSIEAVFDVTGTKGIPGALTDLFGSFSAWSEDPNSTTARQGVLDSAEQVGEAFQQASATLEKASSDADLQLRETVNRINQLAATLKDCNAERRKRGTNDAGLDAMTQNALEELSQLVNFTSLYQADGTVTVLVAGQVPLLVGENLYAIRLNYDLPADPPASYPGESAPARIAASDGTDITSQILQGKLAGLLEIRNETVPSLMGDAYHLGDLNLLAKTIADRVNSILSSGQVSSGPPPVMGQDLFAYDSSSDASVARRLSVSSGITTADLAAIDPGPPLLSNGAALALAGLASPRDAADRLDGFSYVEFYGQVAGRVGRGLSDAKDNLDFATQTVAQARSAREELSGVSLDEEAIKIVEFQRAYQANARLVSILSELTETVLNLL